MAILRIDLGFQELGENELIPFEKQIKEMLGMAFKTHNVTVTTKIVK